MLRRLTIAMAAAALVIPATASAQAPSYAVTRADRGAYDAAVKCFVVIGMLVGDAKDNGNTQLSASYDVKARRSFDFALQLGQKVGLSGTHINEDFGLAQARELPKLVADRGYFRAEAATCRALGLL